jgi:hypothetical protein
MAKSKVRFLLMVASLTLTAGCGFVGVGCDTGSRSGGGLVVDIEPMRIDS